MKKIAQILLLVLILIPTSKVLACTCIGTNESLSKKVNKAYVESDLIFTGKVISKEIKTNGKYQSSADPVIYKFEIIKKIKGEISVSVIEVVSERDEQSCGYMFEVGKSYLVYSAESTHFTSTTKTKSDFVTGLCRRNQKLNKTRKRELRKLNRLANK